MALNPNLLDSHIHRFILGEVRFRHIGCDFVADKPGEVLPGGLAAHPERLADRSPRRSGVACRRDLLPAELVRLDL